MTLESIINQFRKKGKRVVIHNGEMAPEPTMEELQVKYKVLASKYYASMFGKTMITEEEKEKLVTEINEIRHQMGMDPVNLS